MAEVMATSAADKRLAAAGTFPDPAHGSPEKDALGGAGGGRWRLRQCFLWPLRLLRRPRLLLGLGLLLLLLVPPAVLLGRHLWALHQLKVGRTLLERYHSDEAQPYLEACLRLEPGNAQALLLLARVARRAEAMDAAEQYLEEYKRRHGQTEELALEQVLLTAARGEMYKVSNYCYQLVQEDSPAAPLILEALVQGHFRMYRLSEGFAVLQTWLERQPDNTLALLFQAGLHAVLLRHREAVATYTRVLQLDPEYDVARLRLALLLMEDRDDAAAFPHLQYLRQRLPGHPIVAVQLVRCLDHLGQEAEAEQLLEEVLSRNPDFPPALAERGRVALHHMQLDAAETWLREAIGREPSDYPALYHLGLCLLQRGKTAEGQEIIQRMKKLEMGRNRLQTIITKDLGEKPYDPSLSHEFGQILLDLGQEEVAMQWLKRALRLDPSLVQAHHRVLAEYYQRIGDREQMAFHRRFLTEARPARTGANP